VVALPSDWSWLFQTFSVLIAFLAVVVSSVLTRRGWREAAAQSAEAQLQAQRLQLKREAHDILQQKLDNVLRSLVNITAVIEMCRKADGDPSSTRHFKERILEMSLATQHLLASPDHFIYALRDFAPIIDGSQEAAQTLWDADSELAERVAALRDFVEEQHQPKDLIRGLSAYEAYFSEWGELLAEVENALRQWLLYELFGKPLAPENIAEGGSVHLEMSDDGWRVVGQFPVTE
jgi:hypothetical protein